MEANFKIKNEGGRLTSPLIFSGYLIQSSFLKALFEQIACLSEIGFQNTAACTDFEFADGFFLDLTNTLACEI